MHPRNAVWILLMVQKSGEHQFRLVGYPIIQQRSHEISTSRVVQVFFHKQSVLSHESVKTRLPFSTTRFCDIHVEFQGCK